MVEPGFEPKESDSEAPASYVPRTYVGSAVVCTLRTLSLGILIERLTITLNILYFLQILGIVS